MDTFNVQITNLDPDRSLRVVCGDADGEMQETAIAPDGTEVIEAEESWKVEVRLLGVEGQHAPADDPSAAGNGA